MKKIQMNRKRKHGEIVYEATLEKSQTEKVKDFHRDPVDK